MTTTHRARVEATLAEAATNSAALLERLPPEMRATLPVDAQGLTGAIDLVAEAAEPPKRGRTTPPGDAHGRNRPGDDAASAPPLRRPSVAPSPGRSAAR